MVLDDPLPKIMDDGSVTISAKQAQVHRSSELVALALVVPFGIWLSTRDRKLTAVERAALVALSIGTLAVDGYLYQRYARSTGHP